MTVLDATYGALYIGTLVSTLLFGMTNVQTYHYFNYPHPWLGWKIAVIYLWLLDALHLLFLAWGVYHYLITNWGFFSFDSKVYVPLLMVMVFMVIVIASVQSLYTFRIWKLSGCDKRSFFPWPASIATILGYGPGILICYYTFAIYGFADLANLKWVAYTYLGATTAVDVVIAASLCLYLWRKRSYIAALENDSQRSDRGNVLRIGRSHSVIQFIMLYTIASGIVTSLLSVVCMITYATLPGTLVAISIECVIPGVYINSFLVMLNARQYMHNRMSHTRVSSITRTSSSTNLRPLEHTHSSMKAPRLPETPRLRGPQTNDGDVIDFSHIAFNSMRDHPGVKIEREALTEIV